MNIVMRSQGAHIREPEGIAGDSGVPGQLPAQFFTEPLHNIAGPVDRH